MKKTLLIIIVVFTQFTFSQDFKFGKVSKVELEELQHQIDPDAPAAVLYRNQDISFVYEKGKGFVQYNKVYERIKIYNKDGYDFATKTIRLYDESNDTKDKLTNLKAYTYNLKNGKIEETKLKNDGIFDEKTNRFWKETKFTMPNINDGCIIEYRYEIMSQLLVIDDIPFQKKIPINKLDFNVATPEYFKFNALLNPKAAFYPKLNQSVVQSSFTVTESSTSRPLRGHAETTYTKDKVEYKNEIISANLRDIPALKEEVFVDNLSNYQAKLVMELRSIIYPNQPVKSYSNTWEDVTKSIYSNEDFGSQLNKNNYFRKDIETVLEGVTTPQGKIGAIFNFVKSKVKFNGLIGYYTDLGVSKAYKEGSGNVADINLMLVAMLRNSGLIANPVLVSTKGNGIPISATKKGFNYVIAAVELPEGVVLLDGSNLYSTANILPEYLLNWQGRLIREDNSSSKINLQPNQNSKQINFLNATINPDLSVNGKVREQLTNHLALAHRQKYNGKSEEVRIRAIEEGKGDVEVINVVVKAENEINKPILISYEYTLQNEIEEIAGKLYFSSLLFLTPEENPFKQETREYPIAFGHPISKKYVVNIKIPEGYEIETVPGNEKFLFNGNDGVFTYLLNQKNNLLQITSTLDINKVIILPSEYQSFKEFFDLVIQKQTEQIVLKKM